MKKRFKQLLKYFPPFVEDFFYMLFSSPAEIQMYLNRHKQKKFRSYTQLKRHQKRVRMFMAIVALTIFSVFVGVVMGPVFFPQPLESEIYIPNGKGDILIGNVSKNQATVIFKTLDSANGNKPLATKATVEFYQDPNYTKLVRRSNEDDYAVTHIIPVDDLQENVLYYIRIVAKDSATPAQHVREVTSWGNGNDSIKVFTTGDLIPTCAQKNDNTSTQVAVAPVQPAENNDNPDVVPASHNADGEAEQEEMLENPALESSEVATVPDNVQDTQQKQKVLKIDGVQNENYLQLGNKIQTLISWITNVPATSVLIYGEQGSNQKVQVNVSDQMQTKHLEVMTTLKPGTIYYFNVQSKDASGNIVTSEEYSLRTPRPQSTVLQKIEDSFMGLVHQVKPN